MHFLFSHISMYANEPAASNIDFIYQPIDFICWRVDRIPLPLHQRKTKGSK